MRSYGGGGVALVGLLLRLDACSNVCTPSGIVSDNSTSQMVSFDIPGDSHQLPRKPVAHRLGLAMLGDDREHLLLGPAMVRP